ncbi:MAG: hypothetical protein SNJ71_08135 [Bacteroidales bacterium]
MKDLIILTADKNTKFLLQGLLPRLPQVLGIKRIEYDIEVHPERDPGCRISSHEFLRPFVHDYHYSIVIFDYEGCGRQNEMPCTIENEIKNKLNDNGWDLRNNVFIINPEIENWVWIKSPHLSSAINFGSIDELYKWLSENNLISENQTKPLRPKEVFEKALRKSKTPRSSSIYEKIAKQASFKNCTDNEFNKFINQMYEWFK